MHTSITEQEPITNDTLNAIKDSMTLQISHSSDCANNWDQYSGSHNRPIDNVVFIQWEHCLPDIFDVFC
jgi:hypothetical protein